MNNTSGVNYSAKSQEKRKEIKPSISSPVKVKKSSFLGGLITNSDIHDMRDYAVKEVLFPTIKHIAFDVLDMIIPGKTSRRGSSFNSRYVNYNDRFRSSTSWRDSRTSSNESSVRRSKYDFSNIIINTARDAEDLLDSMQNLIDTYDAVSVQDFYDLIDQPQMSDYTDDDFGWTSLGGADVVRTHGGYYLDLPRPKPIK